MKPAAFLILLLTLALAGYWLYRVLTAGASIIPLAIAAMVMGVAAILIAIRSRRKGGDA